MSVHSEFDRFMSADILVHGIWEPFETRIVRALLHPQDTFVDIGANIGWYTLLAGFTLAGGGKVYAFEPDRNNFSILKRNVIHNDLSNVKLECCAVANQKGQEHLFLSPDNRGDHHLYNSEQQRESSEVTVISLDEYFAGGDTSIDMIKMDTQGSESRIFAGMNQIFTRNKERLKMIVEFWPMGMSDSGWSAARLVELMSDMHLECYIIDEPASQLFPIALEDLAYRANNDLHPKTGGFANLLVVHSGTDHLGPVSKLIGNPWRFR